MLHNRCPRLWSVISVYLWTVLLLCSYRTDSMQSYLVKTIAGTGTAGYNGDNQAATSAQLYLPYGLCADTAGNLYIGDQSNNRIRKINIASGIITTYAGSGSPGFGGDGQQATSTSVMFSGPADVWMSTMNVLYIADNNNHRIRVVSSNGIINTFAGNGNSGYLSSDENKPATSVSLYGPFAVTGDTAGNIYIADSNNNRIRFITTSGIITTIAGNGLTTVSDNIAATSSGLYLPASIQVMTNGDYYTHL